MHTNQAVPSTELTIPGDQVWREFQTFAWTSATLTLLWGIVAVTLAWQLRGKKYQLWPRLKVYAVSWNVFHVIILMLLSGLLVIPCLFAIDWPKDWALGRFLIAAGIEVLLFVAVPVWVFAIPLYQLGWNWRRWREDVMLGWLMWIVSWVVTVTAWQLAVRLWPAEEHVLLRELREAPNWFNSFAFTVTAILLVPLAEEALFRGLIQRKMMKEPFWADLTMLVALLAAIVQGYGATSWGPLLFLVTAGPGYLAFEWVSWRMLPRPGLARAVYATSLIFAALHADAWPAPIPLFFFSLGLGILAARTQSLLGPLLIHAAFNACTVLAVFMQQTAGH
ncbi:MAG: CPBP family intramembrane glutamic endopeptidase [Gemmatales bacterium]|nr:CPBP family intramembrane metalloprotease [Gemmatales bacterium]MDW7995588.1 CPBP family intramembrane glutamic endopeptidase [Gemmatales bacterium]